MAASIVVVTGATGFIGTWLCRALAGHGIQVRAVGRSSPPPFPAGVTYHRADLLDPASLRTALAGAETVVHLAARVHVMRETAGDPLAEFRRINVAGTEALMREAIASGVRRFVLASSAKAVAETADRPLTEQTSPAPTDPYGRSKLDAETAVLRSAGHHPIDPTVLRLPLVYGPGMKGNMLRLFRLVDRGIPLPFGSVRNRRSVVFVGNVAAAVRAVLNSPTHGGRTFFVSDGRDVSTPELIRLIGVALGRRVRLVPVPPAGFQLLGRIGDLVSRVAPFPITSAGVDRLLGSLTVDSSALERATGFRSPYAIEEALRLTAEWYRTAGGARR
jgi:nucleoside-diphosphate-sugar epimerase